MNYDLEVPDYGKLPLSMSGLLLTSRAGTTATLTARPDRFCSGDAGSACRVASLPSKTMKYWCLRKSTTELRELRTVVDITTTVTANGGSRRLEAFRRTIVERAAGSQRWLWPYGSSADERLRARTLCVDRRGPFTAWPDSQPAVPFEVVAPAP